MKIALLYSGLPRHVTALYENHKNHILSNIKHVDVYFHFWDIWGYTTVGWAHNIDHNNSIQLTDVDKQNICDILTPKKFIFENFQLAHNNLLQLIERCEVKKLKSSAEFSGNPRSFIFQFYSLYNGFLLIPNEYDVVIRLRTDLEFKQYHINDYIIDNCIHTYTGYCYPDMNDQMGYGSYESMKIYTEVFLNIEKMQSVHPESLLHEQLVNNNILISKDWNIHYEIKR